MNRYGLLAAASIAAISSPAFADASSGHKDQASGEQEIPVCTHRIGTLAIAPPENQWWRELNLGSPEAIIKIFVQRSGCFSMVARDARTMQSRAMEREMADSGELQRGSNYGRGQVKAADYLLVPDIVSTNKNSGGGGIGAAAGGLFRHFGGWGGAIGAVAGSINVKKGEANVTLTLTNQRTTEEEALSEGYARKTDISWGAGGGYADWWGGFAAAGASGYQNTEIGQVIVLAYLDAYKKLVAQLGGVAPLPAPPPPRR